MRRAVGAAEFREEREELGFFVVRGAFELCVVKEGVEDAEVGVAELQGVRW